MNETLFIIVVVVVCVVVAIIQKKKTLLYIYIYCNVWWRVVDISDKHLFIHPKQAMLYTIKYYCSILYTTNIILYAYYQATGPKNCVCSTYDRLCVVREI